jgi:hypothetical protein
MLGLILRWQRLLRLVGTRLIGFELVSLVGKFVSRATEMLGGRVCNL